MRRTITSEKRKEEFLRAVIEIYTGYSVKSGEIQEYMTGYDNLYLFGIDEVEIYLKEGKDKDTLVFGGVSEKEIEEIKMKEVNPDILENLEAKLYEIGVKARSWDDAVEALKDCIKGITSDGLYFTASIFNDAAHNIFVTEYEGDRIEVFQTDSGAIEVFGLYPWMEEEIFQWDEEYWDDFFKQRYEDYEDKNENEAEI